MKMFTVWQMCDIDLKCQNNTLAKYVYVNKQNEFVWVTPVGLRDSYNWYRNTRLP